MADAPAAGVVLVTGAASGMGRATAGRYAAGGWRVALVDRDAGSLAAAADELHAAGAEALAVRADVSLPAEVDAAVSATVDRFGGLDVVIAAAGVWSEGPVETLAEDEFERVMAVNVKGVVFTARAAIAPLRARGGGAILTVASDAGLQANRGAALYCASKGAVVLFSKTLALDLAPDGIRVNAVCPGDVLTPMLAGQARDHGGGDPEGYLRRLLAGYPQGEAARFLDPAEVAELLWFLGQPAARGITGAAISIDQGLSAGV